MIYLDNAATTYPKPESVYVAMDKAARELGVNAGRGSYKLAREASKLISGTKERIRSLMHLDSPYPVVFAPSITIAMNQIVNGLDLREGAVVYLSPYEHNAVARSVYNLSKKKKLVVKKLPLDKATLEIDIEKMKYEFTREKPEAVFCTHVSNVTGYILPVEDIFSESKKYNCVNILDSAQSFGLIDFVGHTIGADIIAFAGHKTLYGPFGIGGFVNVGMIMLDSYIVGGTGSDSLNLEMPSDLEGKYESASPDVVVIAGLDAALKCIEPLKLREREDDLTEYLIDRLTTIGGVKMYLPQNKINHVGIVSFTLDGMLSEDVGVILDEDFDIAVRTGYHCAPYIHEYLRDETSLGTVRVGLGRFTSKEDIDSLCNAIIDILGGD